MNTLSIITSFLANPCVMIINHKERINANMQSPTGIYTNINGYINENDNNKYIAIRYVT